MNHRPAPVSRRAFLAGAAALGLSACGPGGPASGDRGGATKPVRHPYGETQVPISPRRVITLDPGQAMQVAVEHGVPLVASATLEADQPVPAYLPRPKQPFEHLGFGQVDVERLAGFGPDLIVGHTSILRDKYPAMSGLAATVSYANTANKVEWHEASLTVADVFGVRQAQQQNLDAYRARASEFRARHARLLGGRKIVLLRFTTEELRIITDSVIFPSRILTDAGVTRSPSSTPGKPSDTYTSLSPEQVGRLADADAIIHFSGGGASEGGQVSSTFAKYTEGDLWRRLPAVLTGKVFEVSRISWWDGGSTSAANAVLDDLDRVVGKLA
ncbi:ABC transporter substrate-binding protein [Amycolatopsis umgeniensis]|uniref:Iron complex transport system substrate-binding protein n=1 Tax=Amycolatopsis umgeniensis TaxID=336628 RepID=A0A841ARI4_9PSEU|nr:ABC transporter substrate-binding protein [Amycolatopsis umgeniensis]MBB5850506.1 iron complex transport system substrate-binding protein [Amycolatopsis umgeniensis]